MQNIIQNNLIALAVGTDNVRERKNSKSQNLIEYVPGKQTGSL
jgi:hypothetical protein